MTFALHYKKNRYSEDNFLKIIYTFCSLTSINYYIRHFFMYHEVMGLKTSFVTTLIKKLKF